MPEWLTFLLADGSAVQVALWAGAIIALIVAVIGALIKALRLLKKLGNFLDDVAGEPARPGVPARAGLMERVQRIEHELFPNSGKSLRDQTNRMEQKLDRDNERIDEITTEVHEHLAVCTLGCRRSPQTKES